MNQTAFRSTIALVLGSLCVQPALAAPSSQDAIETGQVEEEGSNISWGRAVSTFDQPMDQVLPVVLDYGNYKQFMPNFLKSRVLAQRGNKAMVYMEVGVMKGTFTLWGQVKISERPAKDGAKARIIDAGLVEGNMDEFRAQWKLTPVDGGKKTRVDFMIYVDPDMPLPSSVFTRENVKAAKKTVRALRKRVATAS